MSSIETIAKDGIPYALFLRRDLPVENGTCFVTSDNDPMQVGFFERDAGYMVQPHTHTERTVHLPFPGEFLAIESGRATVTVYDEEWNVLTEREVTGGDCIVFLRGGHGLTMLEPIRILEVKQGPYLGREKEKTFRDAA